MMTSLMNLEIQKRISKSLINKEKTEKKDKKKQGENDKVPKVIEQPEKAEKKQEMLKSLSLVRKEILEYLACLQKDKKLDILNWIFKLISSTIEVFQSNKGTIQLVPWSTLIPQIQNKQNLVSGLKLEYRPGWAAVFYPLFHNSEIEKMGKNAEQFFTSMDQEIYRALISLAYLLLADDSPIKLGKIFFQLP